MKAEFEKVSIVPSQSFVVRDVIRSDRIFFKDTWHFHPELEITLTIKSKGKRFVGTDISNYHPFDLVILGSNLPHCWLTNEPTRQIIIQFDKEWLLKQIINVPELRNLQYLLDKSKFGVSFSAHFAEQILPLFEDLLHLKGIKRYLTFLQILESLSLSNEQKLIQQKGLELTNDPIQLLRIQTIYNYIAEHYHETDLCLEMVAHEINLSKSACCNFIKKNTHKTFSTLLNEVRISQACKLLWEKKYSIAQISHKVGYKDVAYFNRRFKHKMEVSPSKYGK